MNTQKDTTETAKKRTKKEYKKPVLNEFGRIADLTTGGSGMGMGMNMGMEMGMGMGMGMQP